MAKGKKVKAKVKKKKKLHIPVGRLFVTSTYNNTVITLTDVDGNVLSWSSGGHIGYKGARKATAFSAQQAAEKLIDLALSQFQMKKLSIMSKGPGLGREPVIRSFQGSPIEVTSIKDVTPRPHNGTRDRSIKRK